MNVPPVVHVPTTVAAPGIVRAVSQPPGAAHCGRRSGCYKEDELRVLHVSAGRSRRALEPATDAALRTALALAELNVETAVLTASAGAEAEWRGPDAAVGGVPVMRVQARADGGPDWSNQAITPDVCSCLERVRPDIVHVHSLSGLGVQVVDAAREAGAQIVVSMPDLWWVCERGNGVDGTGWSCIPAVTPGSCACRSGSAALAARNVVLRQALRGEDLALAGSETLAARLEASGIRARIEVLPVEPDDAAGWPDVARRLKTEYEDVLTRARLRSGPIGETAPKRVLLVAGAGGPPLRYRVHQKVEQLALAGIASEVYGYTDPRVRRAAERSDVVIIYRAPATRELVEVIDAAQHRGVPTFYDVDDLVFDPDAVTEMPIHGNRRSEEVRIWVDNARRYGAALLTCGRGIASTPELARQMRHMGVSADVHPNGVDTTLAVLSEGARRRRSNPSGRLTVAYCSGTDTHDADLAMVADVLAEFLDRHANAHLVLGGPLKIPRVLRSRAGRVERRGLVGQQEYVRWYSDFDLNLAPLVAHTFTECKSSIKWSEAALVDVATLASTTEPFRAAIDHGVTGLLAQGPDEFAEGLRWAAEDVALVREMGRAARLAAYRAGSPWRLSSNLVGILTARGSDQPAPGRLLSPKIWPSESAVANVEPAGLVGGEFPPRVPMRPGQRLAAGAVRFDLPDAEGAGPLRQVDVHIATWGEPPAGAVTLAIRTEAGVVAEATASPDGIQDNGWATFEFSPGVVTPMGAYAEMRASGGGNVSPYVMPFGYRTVGGHRRLGTVAARVYYGVPEPPSFAREVVPLTRGRLIERRAARSIHRATRVVSLGSRILRRPVSLPSEVRRVVDARRGWRSW